MYMCLLSHFSVPREVSSHVYMLYILYGREVHSRYSYTTRGDIFTSARSAEVNMPPKSYIEAMDRPTVLYIIYTMVSAQQTNLLPNNASQNDAIFTQKVYRIYCDHFAILKFLWVRNHHGIYNYIDW